MIPEILTVSGNYFNFLDPDSSTYTIEDISHALSHINRFTGHTRVAYNVAQHSVMVSHLVPPDLAMTGLMHDASEAFLGDVSSPLKQLLPEYKAIEQQVEASIFKKFGIPFPMPREIKVADLIMLASEQKSLMPDINHEWAILKGINPLNVEIKPWGAKKSKRKFLERFYELKGKTNVT